MTRDFKKSLQFKATAGNKKAAHSVMSVCIVDAVIESLLGYEMNDSGEKIIKRIRKGNTLQEKQSELSLKAANGDMKAAFELLESFSSEINKSKS